MPEEQEEAPQTEEVPEEAPEGGEESAAEAEEEPRDFSDLTPEDLPEIQHPPSPISKQHRDGRGQPHAEPVSITFLTGDFKGKTIDLGVNIYEISHTQSAEWDNHSNQSIRVGANFIRLSPREISLSAEFYDLAEDIAHLGENLAHLQQIQKDTKTPPMLLLAQGSVQGTKCVCTSLRWQYDTPISGPKGYHHAKVEISLQLLGGKGSADQLGPPLTGTPLASEAMEQTEIDRLLEGNALVTAALLAKCLGEEGSEQVADLVRDRKLADKERVMELDNHALFQITVAGMLPPSLMEDEEVKGRVRQATATTMAQNVRGLSQREIFLVAQALLKDDLNAIPAHLSATASQLLADFKLIDKEVQEQRLRFDIKTGESPSQVFDNVKNPTAADIFSRMAHCGMALRQVGSDQFSKVSPDSAEDSKTLADINEFMKDASDEEIRERFGLTSDIQVSKIKNGFPFDSKDDFWSRSTDSRVGITGAVMWQSFENTRPEAEVVAKKLEAEQKELEAERKRLEEEQKKIKEEQREIREAQKKAEEEKKAAEKARKEAEEAEESEA